MKEILAPEITPIKSIKDIQTTARNLDIIISAVYFYIAVLGLSQKLPAFLSNLWLHRFFLIFLIFLNFS